MSRLGSCLLVLVVVSGGAPAATPEPHAVILLYHHVSEQTPASTSVTPAQFERHLEFLAEHEYRVWPLQRVLDAVLNGTECIPDQVVALTFDDAYESVYTEARPRLAERAWPYAVFANTDAIDAGHSPYMSWQQLRALADEGAAIENHSAAHGHMARPAGGESRRAWRQRVADDIARARTRIATETGRTPTLFAYPYGEDSEALAEIVDATHEYALAQRSGPVGPLSDPLSVPRFPMATGFASLERLKLAVGSRPLPVTAIETTPDRDGLAGDVRAIELTMKGQGFRVEQLNCFAATGRRLDTTVRGDDPFDVRVELQGVGRPGRNKINCTAPAADGSGDFFWYSRQWLAGPPVD